MSNKLTVIVLSMTGLALLIILLQNLGGADVSLLFWNAGIPLSLLLLVTYALGAVTARPLGRAIRRAVRNPAKDR